MCATDVGGRGGALAIFSAKKLLGLLHISRKGATFADVKSDEMMDIKSETLHLHHRAARTGMIWRKRSCRSVERRDAGFLFKHILITL